MWEESEIVDMGIAYQWMARWRIDTNPWSYLVIPDNVWAEPYRVDEVVGRRSG